MEFLTIDDFDFKGKTVFLRVDMNCPIDPDTLETVSYTHLTLPTNREV